MNAIVWYESGTGGRCADAGEHHTLTVQKRGCAAYWTVRESEGGRIVDRGVVRPQFGVDPLPRAVRDAEYAFLTLDDPLYIPW